MLNNPVKQVVAFFGGRSQVAKITGLSYMAINKWEKKGRFPRTEYTGETHHVEKLSQASKGAFSVEYLLYGDSESIHSQTTIKE